jgi:antitoxin VapB
MDVTETAKLFMNGRSQAVRLPKSFRFEGKEVLVKKVGAGVLLMPIGKRWDLMREALDEFEPGFKLEREQGSTDVREELFP